jgi:hypothetical protein
MCGRIDAVYLLCVHFMHVVQTADINVERHELTSHECIQLRFYHACRICQITLPGGVKSVLIME